MTRAWKQGQGHNSWDQCQEYHRLASKPGLHPWGLNLLIYVTVYTLLYRDMWEKKPLLIRRRSSQHNSGWFSTQELDRILREVQNMSLNNGLTILLKISSVTNILPEVLRSVLIGWFLSCHYLTLLFILYLPTVAWWRSGLAVGLATGGCGFNSSRCTVKCNFGQVVHTQCPVPLVLQPYGAI